MKHRLSSRSFLPFSALLLIVPAVAGACHNPDPFQCLDSCDCAGGCEQPPQNQPVTISSVRPPPLSGGTLLISHDGTRALVAEPDRDRVVVADLQVGFVSQAVQTPAGAEPGRAVEDAQGRFHVVLREAGAILTIAPNGSWSTTPVCAAPRGIDFAGPSQRLYVTCAGGEVVRLEAWSATAPIVESTTVLEPDLRDVVVSGNKLFVSHFRSAALDVLTLDGVRTKSRMPPSYTGAGVDTNGNAPSFTPDVTWRIAPRPGGGVFMAHQEARSSEVTVEPGSGGGYAPSNCNDGIVHSHVSTFDDQGEVDQMPNVGGLASMALPVDIAISHDGTRLALVAAGSKTVVEVSPSELAVTDGCAQNSTTGVINDGRTDPNGADGEEPVAAQYDKDDNLVVQLRQPSRLEVHAALSGNIVRSIDLGGDDRTDTGFLLFHGNPDTTSLSSVAIACASCHPEGRDDGHVWNFDSEGIRRTQSLAGNVLDTAPFHWKGDLKDVNAVMTEVFVNRMGNAQQSTDRVASINSYLGTFHPAPPVAGLDWQAVARGKALFESNDTGCTACHTGAKLTNNATVGVGTGDNFQVPSLRGVGQRAPYMHDGCAETLADRFGPCGGGDQHGHTSQLSPAQISDMVQFLRSL